MCGRSPPGCRPAPDWSFTSTLSLRSGGLRRARSFEPVDYTVTFRTMSLQSALRVEGLFELSRTTQGVNPRTRFCRCLSACKVIHRSLRAEVKRTRTGRVLLVDLSVLYRVSPRRPGHCSNRHPGLYRVQDAFFQSRERHEVANAERA